MNHKTSFDPAIETLEVMNDRNIVVLQNKSGYRFNSDSVNLSEFTIERITEKHLKLLKAVDLGAGVGILSLILAKSKLFSSIDAIEVQDSLSELAIRNIKINKVDDIVNVLKQDYTLLNSRSILESYDIIVCNPPYKKKGSGKINKIEEKIIARHEEKVDLSLVGKVFNRLLKPSGKAYVVYPVIRMIEFLSYMSEINLEPETLRFIYHSINSNADVFLVELSKGGAKELKVLTPLFIEK